MLYKVFFAIAGGVVGGMLGLMFAIGAGFVIGMIIDITTGQSFGGFGIMSIVFWMSLPGMIAGACYGGVRGFQYG
jgi:hypothetical protein